MGPQTALLEEVDAHSFARRLATGDPAQAAADLRWLMGLESRLARQNRLPPYADQLPQVLPQLAPDRLAAIFEGLTRQELRRALFGNFRVVSGETLVQVFEAMRPTAVATLLAEMALGVDLPRQAARLLAAMLPRRASAALRLAERQARARIVEQMTPETVARILGALSPRQGAFFVADLLAPRRPMGTARMADALRLMTAARRAALLARLEEDQRQALTAELARRLDRHWESLGLVDTIESLAQLPPTAVAEILLTMSGRRQVAVLGRLEARAAAAALATLARSDPQCASELLASLGQTALVRDPDGTRREVLYSARGAVVLEHLDTGEPGTVALLRHVNHRTLRALLRRSSPACQRRIAGLLGAERAAVDTLLPGENTISRVRGPALTPKDSGLRIVDCELRNKSKIRNPKSEIRNPKFRLEPAGFAPAAYPVIGARGYRRSQQLGGAMRWIQIRETVDTAAGPQPLRIDLLELDPARVRLRARRAITEERLIPIAEAERLLGDARRGGTRPGSQVFRRLGVVRLAEEVARTGAIAGINGNFYFDYGNYIDARDLGLDLLQVPGLYFGDVIGWFVQDGVEVSPSMFNRAALIVTDDGQIHIRRVFMTHVELPNGRQLTWDSVNPSTEPVPSMNSGRRPSSSKGSGHRGSRDGGVVLYNGLAGFSTPAEPTYVDVIIARYRIAGLHEGGGAPMPLLGFVISIPRERAGEWLAGVRVGDQVTVGHNFPQRLGAVCQAMACGPQLVRDGQNDLDLEFEDFGEKDSSVVPFSLTRAVDTFQAARSFVMLRQGRLVLGTVSGTALGSGPARVSVGMTFGELAQLCLDLGAEQSIALDGGGSSSVVARIDGHPQVLNVPTGGADVPEGEERFINTYWLVFGAKRRCISS